MDKNRPYTKEDKLLMYQMNQDHVPLKKQVEITGRTYAAIIQFRNKYELVFPKPMNKKDWQEAEKLRLRGYTYSDIARKFGVSSSYIRDGVCCCSPRDSAGYVWNGDLMQKLKDAILMEDVTTIAQAAKKIGKTTEAVRSKLITDYGYRNIWRLKYIFLLEKYNNIQQKSVDF